MILSVGFINTSPEEPLIAIMTSSMESISSIFNPITQGIPRFLATITVCEVGPAFLSNQLCYL